MPTVEDIKQQYPSVRVGLASDKIVLYAESRRQERQLLGLKITGYDNLPVVVRYLGKVKPA